MLDYTYSEINLKASAWKKEIIATEIIGKNV